MQENTRLAHRMTQTCCSSQNPGNWAVQESPSTTQVGQVAASDGAGQHPTGGRCAGAISTHPWPSLWGVLLGGLSDKNP